MDTKNQLNSFRSVLNSTYEDGDITLQSKLQELFNTLKLMGYDISKFVEKVEERVSQDALNALNTEVFSLFSEDDLQKLTRAFNTGLNGAQQKMLVLELYKRKKGIELEEFAVNLYEQISNRLITDLTQYLYIMSKIKSMSDEDCEKALSLIKEDKFDEALEFVQGNKSSDTNIEDESLASQFKKLFERDMAEQSDILANLQKKYPNIPREILEDIVNNLK